MVEAITQIGRTMGIAIIAERVDSAEVLNQLAELGVQYAQGHFIASPQPIAALAALVASAPETVTVRPDSDVDLKVG
jgi:EAL domain-containing protein (putative c-di-GMP-specific phosphodiesterase class I)